MSVSCCHKCTKRSIEFVDGIYRNCHSWCPDYADEVAENEREKALKRKAAVYDDYTKDHGIKARDKRVKRQKDNRGYDNFHKK